MLNQNVKLTSNRREITKTVFAVQNDSGRNLYMQLDDRILNGDELAVFCAVKPSGTMIYNNCTIEEYLGEMTAVCKLTTQALAEVGLTKAQLQITDADGIATSYYFYINVEDKVIDDSAVESTDEFTALQGMQTTIAQLKAEFDSAISAVATDTELTDIRVKADGTTATTAGNAVREQVIALKEDLTLLEKVVTSISLPDKVSILIPKESTTLVGNHYTATGVFAGVGGFVNGKHYKLVFIPETEGFLEVRTIQTGTWQETILPSTYVGANTAIVVDIPNTIDFSNVNKYAVLRRGNSYWASAYLYLYDVTDIPNEITNVIDFTSHTNPLEYQAVKIPQISFHNGIINENVFVNKDASFLGDSLTANGSGGHYLGFVKDGLGLSDTHNCGIGGTRVSGDGATCFWQDVRVNSLSLDSDVLFILGGTNDAPYSTVEDTDFNIENSNTDNFVGAYNVLISKVLYKYLKLSSGHYNNISYSGVTQVSTAKPFFKIILITPPKRFDSLSNLRKVEKFAEYVKRIGEMWGLPVVDINAEMNMNIINKVNYWKHQSPPDWVHFDTDAHRELANIVIGKVKSLN